MYREMRGCTTERERVEARGLARKEALICLEQALDLCIVEPGERPIPFGFGFPDRTGQLQAENVANHVLWGPAT